MNGMKWNAVAKHKVSCLDFVYIFSCFGLNESYIACIYKSVCVLFIWLLLHLFCWMGEKKIETVRKWKAPPEWLNGNKRNNGITNKVATSQ